MKIKALVTMALSLSSISAFANSMELPKGLVELHASQCPEFIERNLSVDSHKLPNSEYHANDNVLYVMGCEMYAYNSLEKAYVVNKTGKITPVVVADFTGGSLFATDDLMGAGFDSTTQTLGTFQKGRGIGDCGSAAVYSWDKYNEKFFLVEAREKQSCDGDIEADWPIIYKK